MFKKKQITAYINTLLVASGLVAAFALFSASAVHAAPGATVFGAASVDEACKALNTATGSGSCTPDQANKKAGGIITDVVNILSVAVGAISVVMIIIGGFRYVVSNGDSNGVSGAKNTILYAVIGLIVVLFAQIIVRFVTSKVT